MSSDKRHLGIPRKWLEVAGWVVLITVLWGTDLAVRFAERNQFAGGKDDFRLVAEQVTSGVAALIMIPFVIRWLGIFPIRSGTWIQAIVGHVVGTGIFALGHYTLMVLMRMMVYAIAGVTYIWREPFFANLLVEYQKDIKIYLGIIAVVIAYRYFVHGRQQGDSTEPVSGRLVVQTGTGTTILRTEQIDYLEAARNYVAVHAEGREYLVRDTLSRLGKKLDGKNFLQAHRSYIVNVDKIREIRRSDSSVQIILLDDSIVPLSRGFRQSFRELLGNE